MKKITILFLLLFITTTHIFAAAKDPIIVEVVTKHKNIEEALQATKTILLGEKFITQEIQKKNFTATRTTGSKADYFVADVAATDVSGNVKITVTFVKVGTGLLNLKKVAERVKAKLGE
jgi:hypothetical protein